MANARVIRNRIKSVKNTGKITKTMAMVSTAKSTKVVGFIRGFRSYQEKLSGILAGAGAESTDHVYLAEPEAKRKLMLVVTANRGLCGGYNSNIVRLAMNTRDEDTDLLVIGKKGAAALRYAKIPMLDTITDLPDIPRFDAAEGLFERLHELFLSGTYKSISVVYSKFLSAGSQQPACEQWLPFKPASDTKAEAGAYPPIYEPGKDEVVEHLVPKVAKNQLYRYLLDAAASEHLARQMAMNSASDNASEMVRLLTLSYNRARQAQITTELSEIVGGAEALK